MRRDTIYKMIDEERDRQDVKWGPLPRHLSMMIWLTIITEEVGECAKAILKRDLLGLITEIVQVAAVAVAWLEDGWDHPTEDAFYGGEWKVG